MYLYSNVDSPLSPEDIVKKFPYLNPPIGLSDKERLLRRLESESKNISHEFAIIAAKTTKSLKETLKGSVVSTQDLILLVKTSKNRLYEKCKDITEVSDLFSKVSDHWSFFDYEFLSLFINAYCPELVQSLEEYKSSLKNYCRRRIVEVPIDMFEKKDVDEDTLFVKLDESFINITLQQIKVMESKLSLLLGRDLYFLKADEGCTELVFEVLCPISPLNESQRSQLSEMGILKLYMYSVHYQNTEALLSHSAPSLNRQPALDTTLPVSFAPSHIDSKLDTNTSSRVVYDDKRFLKKWKALEASRSLIQEPLCVYHHGNTRYVHNSHI